ncbi:hypothetical protein C0J52_04734 [Blattella germanica]|nr:hypothetical protein C0J52_04734 [Blattella germanica]
MMDTRSACMQLKEMCTPIATDLITCSKYKEHVQSFQKEVSSKVTELKETLTCKLKVLKETQKKELVEAVEKVRNLKDEVKLKRVTLHLKNNAIEQRIDEKKTEMEVVNNNLKKELQKIRELMLKEKKKHEELNALSDQHNKNVLKMESSLLDVKNETDLQKNMLTDLKIKIANRGEENKKSEEELVRVKSKIADLDSKKRDVENFIQENNAIELKLTSELKLIREEYDALKQTHDNISDSYSKKLEAITALKAEIQEKQQQHETLVAENTIKIGDVMKQLQEGGTELLNIETLDKQIAESNKTRKYSETLAKQLLEDNKNSTEELTSVQATLHELQESLSAAKLKKEEFQIHSTRQKRELEQELMNVQREQQTSATNSDWILQQTETCVKACKENYAQQVKEKEIMLAALKDESQSLNKEIEDALKENAEDSVDEQSASRILKPSSLERLKNKRVQFQGLGSDSDASLKTSSEDANRKFFKKRTS